MRVTNERESNGLDLVAGLIRPSTLIVEEQIPTKKTF